MVEISAQKIPLHIGADEVDEKRMNETIWNSHLLAEI